MSEETKQLEAGQSLDRLVAEKMGWRKGKSSVILRPGIEDPNYWYNKEGYKTECRVNDAFANLQAWGPSTDIAAAFKLVEFMRSKGYRFHLYEHDRKSPGDDFTGWVAGFTSREPMKMNSQWQGETVPLAICRAFLVLELE